MDKPKDNIPVNPFCEKRRQNLAMTLKMIIALLDGDGKIGFNKALAVVQTNLGVSEAKAREFIMVHVDNETLRLDDGFIYLNKN